MNSAPLISSHSWTLNKIREDRRMIRNKVCGWSILVDFVCVNIVFFSSVFILIRISCVRGNLRHWPQFKDDPHVLVSFPMRRKMAYPTRPPPWWPRMIGPANLLVAAENGSSHSGFWNQVKWSKMIGLAHFLFISDGQENGISHSGCIARN